MAAQRRAAPVRESEPRRRWPPASEAWFARLLAAAPPLAEWQRKRLARLLSPGGGADATP